MTKLYTKEILLETLREVREIKVRMDELYLLFKPSELKRTRKQIQQDRIDKRVAELERDMLLRK